MSLEYEPFSEPLHSLSPNPRTAIVSEAVTPSFVTDSAQMEENTAMARGRSI